MKAPLVPEPSSRELTLISLLVSKSPVAAAASVCAASVADGCGPEDGLILQTGGELLALKWRFSRLLYTWRRENELTQEEAAERCGVSPRHYLDMEAGRVNPKLSTVIHIASESNISLDVLKSEVRGTHAVSLPPE